MLEVKNLNKNFNKVDVLKDVSLKINKKDILVIIGPSGSGKSTLLRCINKLEKETSGDVLYNNEKIKNIDKYREKVGMVFQSFNLFPHLTVLENIILAPTKLKKCSKEEAIKKAIALLEDVNLIEKKDDYPNKLSGGQKQRVAIIRSLMMDPEILLFDEPTSALDPEMIEEVLDLIRKVAKTGMTMIIVSHEMKFSKEIASRVIFMDQGKIIEEGTSKEIFENPKSDRLKEFIDKIK